MVIPFLKPISIEFLILHLGDAKIPANLNQSATDMRYFTEEWIV
jgi:hypothetical protein